MADFLITYRCIERDAPFSNRVVNIRIRSAGLVQQDSVIKMRSAGLPEPRQFLRGDVNKGVNQPSALMRYVSRTFFVHLSFFLSPLSWVHLKTSRTSRGFLPQTPFSSSFPRPLCLSPVLALLPSLPCFSDPRSSSPTLHYTTWCLTPRHVSPLLCPYTS